ncbi:MAG: RNHCP domain-containing protein [Patescibacteria group bacterium]|nr:RNHCP domain-containing protein [Patescibacteria group bacterium]
MRQASFRCLTCHAIISNTSIGTKHRNHCPLCLWSKHVDLKTPGDRRSTCGARMKPIGLTNKPNGELMVVHLCLNCGKVSCNRIAGDDNPYVITCLLEEPSSLSKEIITRLASQGISLLTQDDKQEVLTSLYGYDY